MIVGLNADEQEADGGTLTRDPPMCMILVFLILVF